MKQQFAWKILLAWLALTVVPGLVALLISDWPYLDLPDSSLSNDNSAGPMLYWGLSLALCSGLLIGLAQALVMKWQLGYKSWWALALATLVGSVLAYVVYVQFYVSVLFRDLVGGGPAGDALHAFVIIVLVAVFQTLVLLHYSRKGGWWLPVLVGGWLLGNLLAETLTDALLGHPGSYLPFTPPETALIWGIGWGVRLLVAGTSTALALIWLSTERRDIAAAPVSA